MVFKVIIDSVTRARAYSLGGLKAYLCEQLPACVQFLRPLFIELQMRKLIRCELPRRRVKGKVPQTKRPGGYGNIKLGLLRLQELGLHSSSTQICISGPEQQRSGGNASWGPGYEVELK